MGLNEIRNLKLMATMPKVTKKYTIPKKSVKRIDREKAEKELLGEDTSELNKWFADKRTKMVGTCANCGCPTNKNDDKYLEMLKEPKEELGNCELIKKKNEKARSGKAIFRISRRIK